MAMLLKGAPVAAHISEKLQPRAKALLEKGITPRLAIVRMGEKAGDLAYEHAAVSRCAKLGISVNLEVLDEKAEQTELLDVIEKINTDECIHGCLILRPLPEHIDEDAVCEALAPEKDMDCVTSHSLSRVFSGHGDGFYPCTAQACIEMLDYYGYDLSGARISVIGRSLVVGRPLSIMLQDRDATVTMCHSKTRNLYKACRNKEILIVAAGSAGVVRETFVNPEQTIIDVGINDDGMGGITGDVCFDRIEPLVAAITPVPGGVGSVTATILAGHVIIAAERKHNI